MVCKNFKDFKKNVAINRASGQLYETDIKPLNKTLEKHYHPNDTEVPKLHTAFFDIEVDFDPVKGFASPEEAFMPITLSLIHI